MNTNVHLPMSTVASHITLNVRVTGERLFFARFWMAVQIMKLAALVAGCGINVELNHKD